MTAIKQLIESMIVNYLEESADAYDLVEEVFDELSPETLEAIHEAILNELSAELKAKYAKAAAADYVAKGAQIGAQGGNLSADDKRKLLNRAKGSDTALKKLGASKKTRKDQDELIGTAGRHASFAVQAGASGNARDSADHRDTALGMRSGAQHNVDVVMKNKDAKELSGAEFQKKHNETKAEWKKKSKR